MLKKVLTETCVIHSHMHASNTHTRAHTHTQQPYTVSRAQPAPPPTYFGLALFATLCCFWPLGVAALIKSNEVGNGQVACQQPLSLYCSMMYPVCRNP